MKLYFSPYSCSLNPHIALISLDIPHEIIRVDLKQKKTADGRDFLKINPKGYVPALELDDGEILTEGPVIVQYLADLKPELGLAPKNGTKERRLMQEWLHYIATELHGSFSPLFNPAMSDDTKEFYKAKLLRRIEYVVPFLEKNDYLVGHRFTPADGYLFAVLGWLKYFNIDVAQWPALGRFVERVSALPAVKEALKREASA